MASRRFYTIFISLSQSNRSPSTLNQDFIKENHAGDRNRETQPENQKQIGIVGDVTIYRIIGSINSPYLSLAISR